jgi:hypothetical protein
MLHSGQARSRTRDFPQLRQNWGVPVTGDLQWGQVRRLDRSAPHTQRFVVDRTFAPHKGHLIIFPVFALPVSMPVPGDVPVNVIFMVR